jgi:chromate transporter
MKPGFGEAARFWFLLGWINFGGPAGQITLMHDELVEKRRWIDSTRFLHALNYCMLLPGPEATQLATYVGWLLHGTSGGVLAGLFFILPGAVVMLGLSLLYSYWGEIAWIQGLFYGLGPAVIAVVASAVVRIARRNLRHPALAVLAALAFVAIFFFQAPFPAVILGAALVGFGGQRIRPAWFRPSGAAGGAGAEPAVGATHPPPSAMRLVRVVAVHLVLWAAPIVILGLTRGWGDPFVTLALFFSAAALVTFGGGYAVLSFVAQAAVSKYGWIRPHDMTVGLGLAESTPGPLILVLEFVGYLAGWNHPPAGWSPLGSALMTTFLTLWTTFVPCFLWILAGAPYVERLRGRPALDGALTAITASVVGVILNLAVWLALRVLFHTVSVRQLGPITLNLPSWPTLDAFALVLSLLGLAALIRFKIHLLPVLLVSAATGLAAILLRA